jgi:hypothetical protein
MMRELKQRGLDRSVYLWSDDNLSNDYFWRFLTPDDINLVSGYANYGKVCCFKGFNRESFAFNTAATPDLFDQQTALFARYVELGIDVYGYATFTTPHEHRIAEDMGTFVDRLQSIRPNLPLRVVPLEVQVFAPVPGRMTDQHQRALEIQWSAIRSWNYELERRFSADLRRTPVYAIPL